MLLYFKILLNQKYQKSMNILSLKNINITFGKREILKNISLDIKTNSIIAVSGKSGSGKTTLLSIISGLLKPDSGTVIYRGKNIFRWSDFSRSRYRNKKIGFIFQSFNLLPDYTVYQNITFPAMLSSSAHNVKQHAGYLMKYLEIDNIRNQYPFSISGGEKQRTAVARALINRPEIILADEPTGNLDQATAKSIFSLFKEIQKNYNIMFIIATHDKYIIKNSDLHYSLLDGTLSR
jgi:ABC-type lipoprotein export system ATPase subunit